MKISGRKSAVFLVIIFIFASLIFVSANRDKYMLWSFGQRTEEALEENDKVIATVNGENITNKQLQALKIFNDYQDEKMTDEELLNTLVEKELFYQDALANNVNISDKELNDIIEFNKKAVRENAEAYNNLKEYMESMGMDEHTYWKTAEPLYKKNLIMGRHKNNLKDMYKQRNAITDSKEFNQGFEDFYKGYIEELKQKADITYNEN